MKIQTLKFVKYNTKLCIIFIEPTKHIEDYISKHKRAREKVQRTHVRLFFVFFPIIFCLRVFTQTMHLYDRLMINYIWHK